MRINSITTVLNANQVYARVTSDKNMLFASTALLRYLDPYVPFRSGTLARTARPTTKGVEYIQPYARRLYYGKTFKFTKDFHPLATYQWLEPVKSNATKMRELTQEIERYLMR